MSYSCTRKIEFDSAHRVMLHESKCRNLHGHRYVAEVTCAATDLDALGRVIDFSVIKSVLGKWVDHYWDHGTILNSKDYDLIELCQTKGWKHYTLDGVNPTAEVMAEYLCKVGNSILTNAGVQVVSVRLYETPNCWSDWIAKEGNGDAVLTQLEKERWGK